jgi:hypothetical protein
MVRGHKIGKNMNWTYSTHSQNRDVYAIEDSGEMAVI